MFMSKAKRLLELESKLSLLTSAILLSAFAHERELRGAGYENDVYPSVPSEPLTFFSLHDCLDVAVDLFIFIPCGAVCQSQ